MKKYDKLNPQNKLAEQSFGQKAIGNAYKVDHSLNKNTLATNKILIAASKSPTKLPNH